MGVLHKISGNVYLYCVESVAEFELLKVAFSMIWGQNGDKISFKAKTNTKIIQ